MELPDNMCVRDTPDKWSAFQILSVIVIFAVMGLTFSLPHSQKSQDALNQLVTEESYWAVFYMQLFKFVNNLINQLVQIVNKMELQKQLHTVP
jgi:flagellar basal body-associated protein FliL